LGRSYRSIRPASSNLENGGYGFLFSVRRFGPTTRAIPRKASGGLGQIFPKKNRDQRRGTSNSLRDATWFRSLRPFIWEGDPSKSTREQYIPQRPEINVSINGEFGKLLLSASLDA
jgi:hypothetical protein